MSLGIYRLGRAETVDRAAARNPGRAYRLRGPRDGPRRVRGGVAERARVPLAPGQVRDGVRNLRSRIGATIDALKGAIEVSAAESSGKVVTVIELVTFATQPRPRPMADVHSAVVEPQALSLSVRSKSSRRLDSRFREFSPIEGGVRIGGYSFDSLIYEGSSTLVYAGSRDSDGAPVVGKLVSDGHSNLAHECRVLQKVAGPGIIEALGVLDGPSGPVLVEHRFGSCNLVEALRGGRFTVPRALGVALQLARACARVHAARVIHRDLKPANILCHPAADVVVLCDFGSAAELPVNGRSLPVCDLMGTPSYISPEQTGRTSEGCDVRSDLYSLGVTLYELLTGTVPFPQNELLAVVAAHLSKVPESPKDRVPSIPPAVSDIVMKLLAKQPDERYQSALGLASDLERCLATLTPDGRITEFQLGLSDQLRPRSPNRLLGRTTEVTLLNQALARSATGSPALVLISAREGAGRSELVRALVRDFAPASLLALGGWRAASDRPFVGLDSALTMLAKNILLLDEDRLVRLSERFAARIGQIGQVVLDMVPAMGDVLGPQPPLADLAPAPARARLQHGFRCLLGALGDDAPFVLALQGVEHADRATISLIEEVLEGTTSCRALIVLIGNTPAAFGSLRERPGALSIELGPLSAGAIGDWVAAALVCEPAAATALGEALHAKSAGNSLMLLRLLDQLVDSGVIEYRDGAHAWSLEAVRAAPVPLPLGALASQRIAELPGAVRHVLAAIACTDGADATAVAAMMTIDAGVANLQIAALEREGLVVGSSARYRIAHPIIGNSALAAVGEDETARMRGRLGAHLLAIVGPHPSGPVALRAAVPLIRGTIELNAAQRAQAAELYVVAGEHAMASTAYEVAMELFMGAAAMLDAVAGDRAWWLHRDLLFRSELGRARALIMVGKAAEADAEFRALSTRDLSPGEIELTYPSWMDSRSMVMDRARAVEIGLEGLERLGTRLTPNPSRLRALAAIWMNQRRLARLTPEDHVRRSPATDPTAKAALQVLGSMVVPALFTGKRGLYVLIAEQALAFILKHGHARNLSGFLAVHAVFLHALLGDYAAARRIYDACEAIELAHPAPELGARTYLALHYLVSPWFGPWSRSATKVAQAIRVGVEAGDPMYAALCASGSITLLSLVGTPLDQLVATVEGFGVILRGDGGVAANAANIVNIGGKLTRGEPVTQEDLDRVTNVPRVAASMRTNAMVNLGLALTVIGHERQVRSWLDEIRDSFSHVNFGQPHRMTLWLLDGLFAAKDARNGAPARRAEVKRIIGIFSKLRRKTGATNNDPAMTLLLAELARVDGDVDRAAGLFGRATRDARAHELLHLVAFASEERARMLDDIGCAEEATLYYREAVIAYRRWAHITKALALEQERPAIRALELARSDDAKRLVQRGNPKAATVSAETVGVGDAANEQMDLVTVLKVSQEISNQLNSTGIVRAVLTGIAQNAGAERVVLVLRASNGVETVYGEVRDGVYRDIDVPFDDYTALPKSVVRAVRRTGRPLVVAHAMSDPRHAADPFVVESRSRSVAGIPIVRKGGIAGFVVLENRLVSGAFTPQLVSLAQALVGQAAISLDNASLYEDLENRVNARTAALNVRNAEMRMVLDHVAQGLIIVGIDGRLQGERSAVLSQWFPEGVPGTLAEFFAHEPGGAAWFEIAWEQLVGGLMGIEVGLGQMPSRLRLGDRMLAFEWQPIVSEDGSLERMLVVLSDVTEVERRREADREQKDLLAFLEKVSEDRNGAIEFLREAAAIVCQIAAGTQPPIVEARLLHTLKGNAGLFGLAMVAARCHDIEGAMAEDGRRMTGDERLNLAALWQDLQDKLARVIDLDERVVHVRRPDLDGALDTLRREGHPLVHDLELWGLEPLKVRFERIGEQARALAARLGKSPLRIKIEDGGIHTDSRTWAQFWSVLVHALRNAIDHGLEEPTERAKLGKGVATLTMKSSLRGETLVLELSDDGRGIAWERLRDKARAARRPSGTREDLIAALFQGGISTRSHAGETSGRGVGLGALAEVCRAMGGEISVESSQGVGTTLRFDLPGSLGTVRGRASVVRPHMAPIPR